VGYRCLSKPASPARRFWAFEYNMTAPLGVLFSSVPVKALTAYLKDLPASQSLHVLVSTSIQDGSMGMHHGHSHRAWLMPARQTVIIIRAWCKGSRWEFVDPADRSRTRLGCASRN